MSKKNFSNVGRAIPSTFCHRRTRDLDAQQPGGLGTWTLSNPVMFIFRVEDEHFKTVGQNPTRWTTIIRTKSTSQTSRAERRQKWRKLAYQKWNENVPSFFMLLVFMFCFLCDVQSRSRVTTVVKVEI